MDHDLGNVEARGEALEHIARAVAASLERIAPQGAARGAGAAWTGRREEGHAAATVQHRDGRALSLFFQVQGRRFEWRLIVRGKLPAGREPRITLDPGRDPAAIAREIARRLLPDYSAAFEAVREYIVRRDEAIATAERAARALADRFGGRLESRGAGPDSFRIWSPDAGAGACWWRLVDVYPLGEGPRVELELKGLDVEAAGRVLEALAGALAGGEGVTK